MAAASAMHCKIEKLGLFIGFPPPVLSVSGSKGIISAPTSWAPQIIKFTAPKGGAKIAINFGLEAKLRIKFMDTKCYMIAKCYSLSLFLFHRCS